MIHIKYKSSESIQPYFDREDFCISRSDFMFFVRHIIFETAYPRQMIERIMAGLLFSFSEKEKKVCVMIMPGTYNNTSPTTTTMIVVIT